VRQHHNPGHPEGDPDPEDELEWPPREPVPSPLHGDTLEEKLHDGIDALMSRVPGIRARVRACLLAEGMPELYADLVAEDVAEGWLNNDPAPLYTMPGFVPPQGDPESVRQSRSLRAAVEAWEAKWRAEGGRSS
jgi:hypothetical protein